MWLWRSTVSWHFSPDVDASWRKGVALDVVPAAVDVRGEGPVPDAAYLHGPVPLMSGALVEALSTVPGVQLQTAPARINGASSSLLVVNIIGLTSIAAAVSTLSSSSLGADDSETLARLRPRLLQRAATTTLLPLARLAEWNKPIVVDDAAWAVASAFAKMQRVELARVGDLTGTTLSNYLHDAANG